MKSVDGTRRWSKESSYLPSADSARTSGQGLMAHRFQQFPTVRCTVFAARAGHRPAGGRLRPGIVNLLIALAALAVPSGCSVFRPTLRAAIVLHVPDPDGVIETNTLWANAKPLTVRLRPALGGRERRSVQLRAIHDGSSICFLAMWPDAARSDAGSPVTFTGGRNPRRTDPIASEGDRKVWVWDVRARRYRLSVNPTDMLAFKFSIDGSEDACMMSGSEGTYDVWEWHAGWNRIFGYADDRRLTISRSPLGGADLRVYEDESFHGKIYLQWRDDGGRLPYANLDPPRRRERLVMPAIRPQTPRGSAGDVRVAAVYEDATRLWKLEIKRALDTGNVGDDYRIDREGSHVFAIALGDNQMGADHFTSGLITLRLD